MPTTNDNMVATIIGKVPQEVKDRLGVIARERGKGDEAIVTEALEQYVRAYDHEVEIIKQRLAKARAGGPFVSGEDMERWADSIGTEHELPLPEATIRL